LQEEKPRRKYIPLHNSGRYAISGFQERYGFGMNPVLMFRVLCADGIVEHNPAVDHFIHRLSVFYPADDSGEAVFPETARGDVSVLEHWRVLLPA
jgi:hypothetical protein